MADFNFKYREAVEHFIESTNEQVKVIAKKNKTFDYRYESGWFIRWYIDACHSGSCKDETEDWLLNEKGCVLMDNKNLLVKQEN